ncbi:hypothetical protein HGRIS_006283 [Hohenbuehelia grisea]|uniref:Cytochrome P450 n=1 Tax=Hohenbuehelia grisea TaxID=104357 RepID=A0ABR3JZD4_9AGAR
MSVPLGLFVAAAPFILVLWRRFTRVLSYSPYPPGPKAYPIIGNALDIPLRTPWETYTAWGRKYGSLTHVTAFGLRLIIINSLNVAVDLLENRSNMYSDRPDMPIAELAGWDINIAALRYGDKWRRHRKMYHQKFKPESIHQFRPLLVTKAHELLRNLLQSPEERVTHLRHYPAAIIMYINYGHDVEPKKDRLVRLSEDATRMVAETILKGTQVVNLAPPLRHLPSWFPGFQRMARTCRQKVDEMQNVPYNSVRKHMAEGTVVPSWLSELLDANKSAGEDQVADIKGVTATSFAAAHDTSASVLQFFVLAMILYPESQSKAQAEIDRVIGHGRLPSFDDSDSLPCVEAIYRELLRWRPAAPLGVPHAATEDDIYNGYLIPKGAMIFANIWGLCHDPVVFENPNDFIPERYLTAEGTITDDRITAFGFGRRACVGRALAHETLWLAIATMLSVFRFAKAKREEGEEVDVDGSFTDSLIIHPQPFRCSITPRTEEHRKLVMNTPQIKLDSLQLYWE